MRRPSIYSSDYYRVMRRRKIIIRTLIVLTVLTVVLLIYNRSAVSYLKKLSSSIKLPQVSQLEQNNQENPAKPGTDKNGGKDKNSGKNSNVSEGSLKSEITVNLLNGSTVNLLTEKKNNDTKITGIKDSSGIFYEVRSDGKAIVFDYPKTSDVWIYILNGGLKKLNPDNYKEYKKQSIMSEYRNYIWAAKPYFLNDGRVVYQSYLPWFKVNNSIYLWVVDQNGRNNHMVFSTRQANPVTYKGFNSSGDLIIEYGGSEHTVPIKK